MPIQQSIQRAQTLLQQLSSHEHVAGHDELQTVMKQLAAELDDIALHAAQGGQRESAVVTAAEMPKLDAESGCYVFENKQGYFCPACLDQRNTCVATQRINSRLRVCPACRASIKPKP